MRSNYRFISFGTVGQWLSGWYNLGGSFLKIWGNSRFGIIRGDSFLHQTVFPIWSGFRWIWSSRKYWIWYNFWGDSPSSLYQPLTHWPTVLHFCKKCPKRMRHLGVWLYASFVVNPDNEGNKKESTISRAHVNRDQLVTSLEVNDDSCSVACSVAHHVICCCVIPYHLGRRITPRMLPFRLV